MVSDVLTALDARPPQSHLIVLSDFDGTLAAFDVDPAAPQLSVDRTRVLDSLAAHDGVTVGLISGRRVDDIDRRTRLSPLVYLAGLHGMEIRHGAVAWHHPELPESGEQADAVADALQAAVGHVPGVRLEHKGVAVTVHVRGVNDQSRRSVLNAATDAARPWLDAGAFKALDLSEGIEFLPNIAWTKGDAVRWIVEDVERRTRSPAWCVFFGDDLTDEDAFRAVGLGLSVVVGNRPSTARLRLSSPDEVAAVLAGVNRSAEREARR